MAWETMGETLLAANVSWKLYQEHDNFDDNGFQWFDAFKGAKPGEPLYDRGMARTEDFVAAFAADVAADALPAVSWLVGPAKLSEHASNHPADGEDLTARLLAILAAPGNAAVYAKTAFILVSMTSARVRSLLHSSCFLVLFTYSPTCPLLVAVLTSLTCYCQPELRRGRAVLRPPLATDAAHGRCGRQVHRADRRRADRDGAVRHPRRPPHRPRLARAALPHLAVDARRLRVQRGCRPHLRHPGASPRALLCSAFSSSALSYSCVLTTTHSSTRFHSLLYSLSITQLIERRFNVTCPNISPVRLRGASLLLPRALPHLTCRPRPPPPPFAPRSGAAP